MKKIILLQTLLLAAFIQSKNTQCRNKFNQEDFIYCTKFGGAPDSKIDIYVKAKYLSMYKKSDEYVVIQYGIYREDQWDSVYENNKLTCQQKKNMALHVAELQINVDGTQGLMANYTIPNYEAPRMYFFAVMDCDHNTHSKLKQMPRIEVQFDMTNEIDGVVVNFSYEDQGKMFHILLLLLIFIALFTVTIKSYVQYNRDFNSFESPHMIMCLSLFLQLSGIFFEFLDAWMYSNNGVGIPIFDIFGLISLMMSEISMQCLLIMIAQGWTLTFAEINWDDNLEFYLPIGAIVIAIHLVLAALTYVDIDASHKYHDYAGLQGWALVTLKLALFAYYIYSVYSTKDKIPKRSQEFYRIFVVLGVLYFMVVPTTLFLLQFLMPYNRQYFFMLCTNLGQMLTVILLLQQQMSTKSKYFKATLNALGLLPISKAE